MRKHKAHRVSDASVHPTCYSPYAPLVKKDPLKRSRKAPAGSSVRSASARQSEPTPSTRSRSVRCNPPQPASKSTRTNRQPQHRSAYGGLKPEDLNALAEGLRCLKQHLKDNNVRVNKIDSINSHRNIVDRVTTKGTGTTINVGGTRNAGSGGLLHPRSIATS